MQKSHNRPKPVSCQSCRSKKLKCNRVQPCSNCSARGITCSFLVAPAKPEADVASHDDLQERLQRLEALLTPLGDTHGQSYSGDVYRGAPPALTPVSIPSDDPQTREKEHQVLENVATREDTILPSLSDGLEFRICSMHEIIQLYDSSSDAKHIRERHRTDKLTIICPDFPTATELFRSYEHSVDHVCRILHTPSVRAAMKTFYLRLGRKEAVVPGQAALLLSIFAIAAYFLQHSAKSEVAILEHDGICVARVFGKAALDVLDHSRRNTSCTLEDVQAHVIMSMVAFQFDGFSARGRLLSTTALSIARDLRLHQLDASSQSLEREGNDARTLIDLEVKRRVFWYIASTDWLWAAVSGPQEGTYFIQPNHIQVRLPRDCTDDEIVFPDGDASTIEPQPTGTAYLLQRVKLAHLCREMVDLIPLDANHTLAIPYDQIIAFDRRLIELISTLPFFFKTDPESRAKTAPLEVLYPALPYLRYSIIQAAHSRRCRLHQRFLFRQSVDPRYSYSRRACLESAQAVIQSDQDIHCPDPPWLASARPGLITHFKHLATVILVMDLCFNPDQPDTTKTKAVVKRILDRFESARHLSPLLDRFLNSLHNILRKHHVDLDPPSGTPIGQAQVAILQAGSGSVNLGAEESVIHARPNPEGSSDLVASVDEFWLSNFEDEPQIDLSAWDDMFSTLDSRPM